MSKVKIAVVGPVQSGKTAISNILSEATETSGGEYHATQGVRILEFEVPAVSVGGKNVTAEVELWDCSGDHKFESCWPVMARDTSGVVFVFNPDEAGHNKDLETWYAYYVDQQGLRESQCIAFAHNKATGKTRHARLAGSLERVECVDTSLEDDGDSVKQQFNRYLCRLLVALSEKRDQEEMTILNTR